MVKRSAICVDDNKNKEVGEELNKHKTKVMVLDRQNKAPVTKNINNIKSVDSFIYNALISNRGGSSQEIRRKLCIN